jgi:hypothetical protein
MRSKKHMFRATYRTSMSLDLVGCSQLLFDGRTMQTVTQAGMWDGRIADSLEGEDKRELLLKHERKHEPSLSIPSRYEPP